MLVHIWVSRYCSILWDLILSVILPAAFDKVYSITNISIQRILVIIIIIKVNLYVLFMTFYIQLLHSMRMTATCMINIFQLCVKWKFTCCDKNVCQWFLTTFVAFWFAAYIRHYEQVLSLKMVETLRRMSSLFVKHPLFWDFVIEALTSKFAPFCITVFWIEAVLRVSCNTVIISLPPQYFSCTLSLARLHIPSFSIL